MSTERERQDARLEVRGPSQAEIELAKGRIMQAAHQALEEIGQARVADGVDFGLGWDFFGLDFSLSWDAIQEESRRA